MIDANTIANLVTAALVAYTGLQLRMLRVELVRMQAELVGDERR